MIIIIRTKTNRIEIYVVNLGYPIYTTCLPLMFVYQQYLLQTVYGSSHSLSTGISPFLYFLISYLKTDASTASVGNRFQFVVERSFDISNYEILYSLTSIQGASADANKNSLFPKLRFKHFAAFP